MTTRTRIAAVATAAVLALSATACGDKGQEPRKDAARSGTVNTQPMDVIEMADGFSNVGTKCDHGNRIYVIFHHDDKYGSVTVAPNDPSCANR